jgi:hypothetical protein
MAALPELCDELAVADLAVTEGQDQIARQVEVLCALDTEGHDTRDAKNVLLLMQRSLDAMNAQRQEIVQELAYAPDEEL